MERDCIAWLHNRCIGWPQPLYPALIDRPAGNDENNADAAKLRQRSNLKFRHEESAHRLQAGESQKIT
jgi:hypothetical protein